MKGRYNTMMTMKKWEKMTGVKFNSYMTGKMEGITCLSTSNLCNPFCAARKDRKDMICSRCYADASCKNYKGLRDNMARNTEILTTNLFDTFPVINAMIFRLEAFGDLVNCTQARNYLRLCKANPGVRFALWTKNPGILAQAIKLEGKPENLVCILSSAKFNETCDASRWSFIDKTFTVYDKATIAAQNVAINGGSRNCLACQRCYHKNTETNIREQLK